MALNIGTLVGYLSLDDTNFNRKADAADRKINALKLHLEALKATNPKISVEVDAETARLDELQAKIRELKVEAAKGVDVKVELTQAMIELDRVQTKLRDLHNKEVKVKVDVDDAAATAKVESLDAKLSALQSKIRGNGGPGWMPTLIAGLGPALLPTLTAATGGMIALGSGAVAAAGGIGVLKLAFHGLSAEVQAYQKYQQAMSLATTAKQRQAAQLALNKSAYGTGTSASQDMTRFLVNQGAPALHQLQQRAQSATFPGVTKGLRELISILPVADRLVWRFGSTMGGMAAEAGHALKDPFWTHWFAWLGKEAKTDLPLIGSIFGHTFEAIARMIQRFSPQGTSLLHWIDDLAKKFDQWTAGGKGSSFESFLRQIRRDGPALAQVLREAGPLLGHLLQGLNQTGVGELHVMADGLRLLSKIPAGPLRAIGEALPLIVLGLKGIGLARGAAAGLVGVAGLLSKVKGFGGLGRLGGAAAGELGGVALGKGVVPVYVTNKGFGGPGGGGLAGDLGKAGGGVAAGLSTTIAAAAAGALAIYFGSQYGSTKGQVNSNAAGDYIHQQMALNGQNYVGSPYGSRGYVSGTYVPQAIRGADYSGAKKAAQDYATTVVAAMATANRATAKYREELASLPKKVQTAVQTPGAVQSMSDVRALQHQYDLTPKQVRTLIQLLGGQQAINIAAAVQAKLDALHSKDVTIRVNEIHATSYGPHAKAVAGNADGGHVTGPGTGTSDSIPARLSNGEYVIRASAVKRYGVGLFDALNAERFASGGRVHRHHLTAAQRRHNQLLRDLALAQKLLGHTNATIGNAQSFGSAFAGNVFAAGLPTTKQVTVPGKTFTQVINGQLVTESTPATTKTVNLSQQQILANMLKYQRHQLAQARQVEHDVRKLRREGVSRSLLAQMQAGGAQGIAQIHALAQGSTAQVHQFNRLNAATNSALNNAGAYAAANQSMHHLQRQKASEESMVRAIRQALRHDGPIPVAVKRGKLRTV